ncbi:hypothetical protein, partial [Vaccinium witches'-broom phytoplasma]|uniref:hypothetical protein n=1 Tax=Vaccinium witches'-broom phytoplasma TaxID=85642 RepID=UPI000572974D
AEKKVTVKANEGSQVYTGTATVTYTVKAESEVHTSGPRKTGDDNKENEGGTSREQAQENAQVDINTVVAGELGEQAAELTNDTAKAAVKNKFSSIQINEVTVTVDTAEKKVTVKANEGSQVYTGTATVTYTVKAESEVNKLWYKSVTLWVSVGVVSTIALVGAVYCLNKNKKI